MDKAFSSIDLVGQCLLDEERTLKFKEAIDRAVKTGMGVIDVGTGSGIMAIFAAKAGASKVFAIELDRYVASVARSNFESNGLKSIELIEADARLAKMPMAAPADVIIMEMLTTGMIDEFQIPALRHLRDEGYITENTVNIPQRQQSFLSMGHANFDFLNVHMPMPLHTWKIHSQDSRFSPLTNKVIYDDYDFKNVEKNDVDFKSKIPATKSGVVNAVLLESTTILDSLSSLDETPALNGKVIIPIKPFNIKENSNIVMSLKYGYGNGFEGLHIQALPE